MKTNKLNAIQSIAIIALVAVIGFAFTACDDGSGNNNNNNNGAQNNQTPVASDFNISGTSSVIYNGDFKTVTVTAKTGKTTGDITVYYLGTGQTEYEKSEDAPMYIGTYTVTFNVSKADGWDAVEGFYAGTLTITDGTPSVPSNVSVSVASATSLKVSWSTVTGATSYKVYFIDEDCAELELAETVTTTSYTHTGLTADVVYFYYVTAVNTYGQSNYSTFKAAKISIPDTPASVVATPSSSTAISLRWSSVTGATSYKVYCATSETGVKTEVPGSLTSTSGSVTGLTANTTYYFFVKAVNALGESGYSPAGSAKTLAAPGVGAPTWKEPLVTPTPSIWLEWNRSTYFGTSMTSTGYYIYWATSPNATPTFCANADSLTQYIVTNVSSNTTYYFYITAYRKSDYSETGLSAPLVVTTGSPPPPSPIPPTLPSSPLPTTPPSGGGSGERICTSNYCTNGKCYSNSLLWTCNNGINSKTGKKCGQCNGTGKHPGCNGTGKI